MYKKEEILGSILYLINKTFVKYPDTEKIMGENGHLNNVVRTLKKHGIEEVPNYMGMFEEYAKDQLPGVITVEESQWAIKYYSDIAFLYGVMLVLEDPGPIFEETEKDMVFFFKLLKQLISKVKYQVDNEGKEFWIVISASYFGYYVKFYRGKEDEKVGKKTINLMLESLGLPKIFVEEDK